jgi:hypothetical protein
MENLLDKKNVKHSERMKGEGNPMYERPGACGMKGKKHSELAKCIGH